MPGGVRFRGFEESGVLVGVMGIQEKDTVTLIRHAYVRTSARNKGVGSQLLQHLRIETAHQNISGLLIARTHRDGNALQLFRKNLQRGDAPARLFPEASKTAPP